MGLACDIILIGIIIFTLYSGWSKGFVRSLLDLVNTIAAGLVAFAYTPVLKTIFKEQFIHDTLTKNTHTSLLSLAQDTKLDAGLYNLDKLANYLSQGESGELYPKQLADILKGYGVSFDDFISRTRGMTAVTEEVVKEQSALIVEGVASTLSAVIAFLLLFIGSAIILFLITALLDLIFRLPSINTGNKMLGIFVGAAEAVLLAAAVSILLSTLIIALGAIDASLFGKDVIDNTILTRFIRTYNPLNIIGSVLN